MPTFKINLAGALAPLQYAAHPKSQLVMAGTACGFQVAMAGEPPVSFEWFKNGKSVRGGIGEALEFASVKAGDAGRYLALARNSLEGKPSEEAFLGVLARAPAEVKVIRSKTLSLTARATAPAGASVAYEWQHNGVTLEESARVSGVGQKVLRVTGMMPEDAGDYTCRVIMQVGGQTAELTHGDTWVSVVEIPELEALDFSDAFVGETVQEVTNASHQPTQFTATGLPPGVRMDKTTGVIHGKPVAVKRLRGAIIPYRVTVTASNAAGKTTQAGDWAILPLPEGIAGHYQGLLARQELLNKGLGGSVKLSVQPSAAFSGSLTLESKRYSFAGSLDVPGDGGQPKISVMIPRRTPLSALKLTCHLDPASGALTGKVNEEGPDVADVTAWRSPWNAGNRANSYTGHYNAALLPQLPEDANATVLPHGEGFAILKVGATGMARWTGSLADGSALTGSAALGQEGQVALHALFHRNSASIHGWISITVGTKNLDGTVDWMKLPPTGAALGRVYSQGFPLHALTLSGGLFSPPEPGQMVLDFAPPPLNARLSFTCEGGMEAFEQPLSIGAANTVSVPINESGVKVGSLNAKTGLFRGQFRLVEEDLRDESAVGQVLTRSASFHGVLIPRLGRGVGRFLLPLPPVADEQPGRTPIVSGRVSLDRAF
jgi:hypothetical protein